MRSIILVLLLPLFVFAPAGGVPPPDGQPFEALKAQAEESYAEKSFSRAHELYLEAQRIVRDEADRRWTAMRLADTAWRAAAANPSADDTIRNAAREALETLLRESGEEHDRVWAEAQESLGDFFLQPRYGNPSEGRTHLQQALEWWAGSPDLSLARRRYLDMVYRMVEPRQYEYSPYGGPNVSGVSGEVLANAMAIAESAEDQAHTRFLFGKKLLQENRPAPVERGLEVMADVIHRGRESKWYADALNALADRFAQGVPVVSENGAITWKSDYPRALALYGRLLAEFARSETIYYDNAKGASAAIASPSLQAMVSMTFLPASEQEIALAWRNVKEVAFTITPVDLIDDATHKEGNLPNMAEFRTTRAPVRQWKFSTNDKGDHVPGQGMIRISPKLPPGAYIVDASSGEKSSRQRVLVSDANILAHTSNGRTDLFICSAVTGEPIADARIRLWQQQSGNRTSVRDLRSDAHGMASAEAGSPMGGALVVATSAPGNRQASLSTWSSGYQQRSGQWRVYAFTDRPAYRPEETVHWKIIARTRAENEWLTPSGQTLAYDISGPRGEKVASGIATLNQYGSFWADLPLTASMALGSYQIQFRRSGDRSEAVGGAMLFRLEEYKLPEFRVDVKTEGEQAAPKRPRSGDVVEAVIEARYYFGGPVANATVEVSYRRTPFAHRWYPWREYDWYYELAPDYGGRGEVESNTVRTDANGRAVLRIETSPDDADTEYHIEARVTDASRREVVGRGSVRVTRQSYSVVAHPDHYLHAPGDKVNVTFKALDANDQPVQAAGTVKVLRRTWDEIWVDPMGREVKGRQIERQRAATTIFPPPSDPPWRRKFAGYRDEVMETHTVATDRDGVAKFGFTPATDGYYAVQWTSVDRASSSPVRARDVVTSETAVWVSRRTVGEIGYHAGGLEIIVDRESFRSGSTAPVMIATPASGQWVLFTTSADGILETQVLHLDGTVKLVQVPIDDRHTPSFFITASSVHDAMLATSTVRVVVPPVEHFIDVDVKTDREEYRPGQEGSVTVTTRDIDGKPVPAEVALSLSDESVTAIQQDPAGDPRKFFFENRYGSTVQAMASVQEQRYITLVEEDGKLIDERNRGLAVSRDRGEEKDEGAADAVMAAKAGGVVNGPAPPMARAQSVAESITVTASAPAVIGAEGGAGGAPGIEVVVRSDFRSTAFWQPDVITGADGVATVNVKLPEALTTWRATARAVSTATEVGMSSTTTRTSMPMLVRLEAPRFFVSGDRATVSAVVNNNTDRALQVRPSIAVEGVRLAGEAASSAIEVPPHGEARADWTVVAEKSGPAKVRVTGVSEGDGALSDAMEKSFVVYEHGIDKLVARSGKLRGDEAVVRLNLPSARRATSLTVQLQPSLATAMLDALPYLIEFPYGCTEQTMSRFLPAAVVARTLAKSGLDRDQIEARMFGGIEPASAAGTHPGQRKNVGQLDAVIAASKTRLLDFQHGDGGWGWWKEGSSDPFMTGYVVWGFAVLREGEMDVPSAALERAVRYLGEELVRIPDDGPGQAWILHAIGAWRAGNGSRVSGAERRAFDKAFESRQRLTAYSRALLALAAHDFGEKERAAVLVRNLEDGVKLDRSPDASVIVRGSGAGAAETITTAHWGEDRFWWRWSDGPVESTAFALEAIMAVDPKNALVEPAMSWLVKNRRGAQWNNTRDTAIAILALDDYLRSSGELATDGGYELSVNGRSIASRTISRGDVLTEPGRFTIDPALVNDANEIRIRRTGGGALYFSVEGRFVSLEEPVTAAGNEIFVRRDYYRLAPRPTLLKGVVYDRVPLRDGGVLGGGERVEVVVTVETKNDYDYLLFEDLKPAGLEAVELRSGGALFAQELKSGTVTRKFAQGEPPPETPSVMRRTDPGMTGRSAYVYQELRDRKVALFIDHLPQGVWEIRYTLRAEVLGSFHALPLLGQAMYVPEIRANSEEVRMEVR